MATQYPNEGDARSTRTALSPVPSWPTLSETMSIEPSSSTCHNCIGHKYMGHNNIGHNYVGP